MIITPPHHTIVPGVRAFLVGGSVRDMVLGRVPFDYDIAVDRAPEAYAALLAKRMGSRVIPMGKDKFTVYRVISGETCVDIAPTHGADIMADLSARDFTINALACELPDGRIIDPTNGLADIKRHVVRMVSPDAFTADPIRLLRAFRMAAVLGFDIEPHTLDAIRSRAATIYRSAGERIFNEVQKILACIDSQTQVVKMNRTGLLSAIFPELIPLDACRQNRHHHENVLAHTMTAYRQLEKILDDPHPVLSGATARWVKNLASRDQILLKLAILLHDIGKPASQSMGRSGEPRFHGHAAKSAELLQTICQRLRMSNQDRDRLVRIVGDHQRPLDLYLSSDKETGKASSKALGRFFRHGGDLTPAILLHALADNMAKTDSSGPPLTAAVRFIIDLLSIYFETIQSKRSSPLIDGDDLIRHFGLSPSPLFGSLLKQVEEAYLAGSIENRKQALRWVEDMIHPPGDS